ncbi:DUF1287 domain-containing protein [Flagellimonas sp.]|uniref:DUF1287 domain-containing protein n=1 Tax=Flagellimonas sp. TaxID=2058762 RepID=UPI0034BB53E7
MKVLKFLILLFVCQFSFSQADTQTSELADAALELTKQQVTYDPSYFSIAYPNGDVPSDKGVCTDVIVRAYRKIGIDLQERVHRDMKGHFQEYPKIWGLQSTDTNIDHRRVPNLMTYFKRQGASLPISNQAVDYLPGDVVCWNLGGGTTHIGIVSHKKSRDGRRYLIVHNIGRGQVLEDCLFDFKIIGHFRYP